MLSDEKIQLKKQCDDSLYSSAMQDLLSVLNISGPDAHFETHKAIIKILMYFGEKIPEIPKQNINDLDQQIEMLLKPSGMLKRRVELRESWWKDSSGALLVSTKSGDIIALLPGKWSGYYYTDKDGKTIRVNARNAKNFSSSAFCFYKPFKKGSLKILDLVKFMVSNISTLDFTFLVTIYIVIQLLNMTTPYLTNIIYNILIPSESMSLFQTVSFTMLGLTIGKLSISITQNFIKARIKGKLNLAVHSAVMMRLFSLPVGFFKKYSAGDLSSRMGYVSILCSSISETFLSTFLTTLLSLTYIFQMISAAPSMVGISMLIIFISVLFSISITLINQSINDKKTKLAPKLQSLVFNIFSGMQKIKIAGAEKRAFSIWAKEYSKSKKLEYDLPFIIKTSGVIEMLISSLGSLAIYWIAAKNQISISNYMTFNVAYGAFSSAIASLNGVALQFTNLRPSINLIKPFLETETENSSNGKLVTSLHGNIEMNNITFRYQEKSDLILNNLSLKIKKGEYVAIVGKTGCGKSTIMRLLLGFENPEQGGIYYDKRDINGLDKKSLRQKIGVVMQNGAIFQGDIFSNIIVTAPWKNLDDAWEAARMAGLDKDIENMPMGMHTLISEGSGGISGGQKQRLMIARALISKPKILFFDEATSALDNITQKIVSDNIDKLKCTRIVIAHRLSTIKNCDRILVLANGQIAESGSFDELMKKKGLFFDLAIRQIAE